ncbi:DUF4395 domain-containing protein [Kitasatospora camelliae]|uniref:DUF4395 domain-containing protein n=1 Tax=Kitasatospora camelliae TaxID=3156397 RepID=A0AAU8JUQ0_9ACTN
MQIDPRGARFAAVLTSLVLAAALITGSAVLLAAQAAAFAVAAFAGPQHSPYGLLFGTLVRPRIGPPRELEDARPARFAQAVGLAFAVLGTVGSPAGAEWLFLTATGFALGAAFLNAAFGYCLGCELYLLAHRGRARLGARA